MYFGLWAQLAEMQHHRVFFDAQYYMHVLSLFKKKIEPLLEALTIEKYIFYTYTHMTGC
jgi:hypothetical protein